MDGECFGSPPPSVGAKTAPPLFCIRFGPVPDPVRTRDGPGSNLSSFLKRVLNSSIAVLHLRHTTDEGTHPVCSPRTNPDGQFQIPEKNVKANHFRVSIKAGSRVWVPSSVGRGQNRSGTVLDPSLIRDERGPKPPGFMEKVLNRSEAVPHLRPTTDEWTHIDSLPSIHIEIVLKDR